jgi:peptidoglycan/LPS O-acetylase OafA/YrhL
VVGYTGLALIVLACIRLDGTTPYPGVAALVPVLGTAMVIVAGCAEPHRAAARRRRRLSSPPR